MINSSDEIAARRVALGYTRNDAGDLAGVKESAIRSIEQGKTPHGGQELVLRYMEWLEAVELRASKDSESPILHFPAKAFGAEPVLDEDGVQVPGMWLMPDRGNGHRYAMQEPTIGECAGWTPGRVFRVDGVPGTFRFQRLMVHATTGVSSVEAYGGTSTNNSFRSFRPERILS